MRSCMMNAGKICMCSGWHLAWQSDGAYEAYVNGVCECDASATFYCEVCEKL